MRFIEQVIDGIICTVAVMAIILFAIIIGRLFSNGKEIVPYSNPMETPAEKIKGDMYEKEISNDNGNDSVNHVFYWSEK